MGADREGREETVIAGLPSDLKSGHGVPCSCFRSTFGRERNAENSGVARQESLREAEHLFQ